MIPYLDTLFTKRGVHQRKYVLVCKNFVKAIRTVNQFFPYYFAEFLGELLGKTAFPLLAVFFPKLIIDYIQGEQEVRNWIFLSGFALIVCSALAEGFAEGKYYCYNAARNDMIARFFCRTMDGNFQDLDSARGRENISKGKMALLWGDGSGFNQMHQASMDFLICITSFFIYAGVFFILRWWVVILMVLLSEADYCMLANARKYEETLREETADLENKLNYIEKAAGDISAGKDVRIFHLEGLLKSYSVQILNAYRKKLEQIRSKYFSAEVFSGILVLIRDGISYLLLIAMAYKGMIDAGEFVLYAGAVSSFGGWMERLTACINSLFGASQMMEDAEQILNMKEIKGSDSPDHHEHGVEIQIKDLVFSYESSRQPVFQNFNLHVHRGEKVALVGLNGAGKTTLVQLLCGFYLPQAGEIFIDGKPVSKMKREEQMGFFSVMFQENAIFPLTVAENIALCELEKIDRKKVRTCLERVGLWKIIEKQEKELDAPMTKWYWDDGIVFSGGQQQMFLLARSLYKEAPVLILDEPTAALDAVTEDQIYQKFHQFSDQKTTLFISHRMASTRFCDRILLLDQGKIVEEGTHEELLKKGGRYAQLFTAQSSFYCESDDEASQKGGAR